jgi:hypothetical protein
VRTRIIQLRTGTSGGPVWIRIINFLKFEKIFAPQDEADVMKPGNRETKAAVT